MQTLYRFTPPPWRIALPALVAALYCWLLFASTFAHVGRIGPDYNAVGTDWMVFHGAAQRYLDGHFISVFNGAQFTGYLNDHYAHWLNARLTYRPWLYPPTYLLLLLPFGALGFLASYLAFQALSAAGAAAALFTSSEIDRTSARSLAIATVLCPAAAINAILGQNAFLIAAILVTGMGLLDRRKILAGLVLGLVAIKPQYALLLPIGLAAGREWRSLVAAAASVIGLAVVSLWLFGSAVWLTWIQQSVATVLSPSQDWMEFGKLWDNSVWTCAFLLGVPARIASILQLAAMAFAAAAVTLTFRRTPSSLDRLIVLLAATLFAAPHWVTSDALMLAIAGLLWITRSKQNPYAWIFVLMLWLIPLFSPVALVPIGRLLLPLLIVTLLVLATPPTSDKLVVSGARQL